jgi:hypothetical protein
MIFLYHYVFTIYLYVIFGVVIYILEFNSTEQTPCWNNENLSRDQQLRYFFGT